MINYSFDIDLPSARGKIVEDYKRIFEIEEKYVKTEKKYDAYSIDDNLEIIKGVGVIKSNGMWNYHNNYDDSEDELYFIPSRYPRYYNKWWTPSLEEAKKIQKKLIKKNLSAHEKIVKKLKSKL